MEVLIELEECEDLAFNYCFFNIFYVEQKFEKLLNSSDEISGQILYSDDMEWDRDVDPKFMELLEVINLILKDRFIKRVRSFQIVV